MKFLARLIVTIGCLAVLIWFAGFLWFTQQIARLTPPPMPHADGIVALTGGGGRIEAGLKLLQAGAGKKLLISGVHPEVTKETLLANENATGLDPRLADCCVKLGYAAWTTDGNATEAADWARAEKFKSLIVVTAQYHLPRALLDFHRALPSVELVPYPLPRPAIDAAAWWQSWPAMKLLMVEYTKYGGALLRATAVLFMRFVHV